MIWPTIKRLRFLERERMQNLGHIASLMDENEDLKRRLADSLRVENALAAWVSRLMAEKEIESMLREAEDA